MDLACSAPGPARLPAAAASLLLVLLVPPTVGPDSLVAQEPVMHAADDHGGGH